MRLDRLDLQTDWNVCLQQGPRLSIVIAAILIIQTVLYDPSASIREEISSRVGKDIELEEVEFAPPSPLTASNQLEAKGKRRLKPQQNEHSWGRLPQLYSPSIWPYSDMKGASENFTDVNATAKPIIRYPGLETVLTDYTGDVLVPLDEFIVMDLKRVTVPRDDGTNNGSYATCRFQDFQYSFYFPHLAQQLFRCWSFWRANPNLTPVFVASQSYHWELAMEKKFNRGLINIIQHAGVQVLNTSSVMEVSGGGLASISARSKGPILHQTESHYQVASPADMPAFRKTALSSLNLSQPVSSSFCGHPSNFPRIGILSRRKSRRIKNVREVALDLKSYFNLSYNVPVLFFEDAAFRDQVGMMASIDILVTPHGAQETGVAFMPRCGGVLEVLPNQYFFPRFYGTLAATAGLQHSYIYLAGNASDQTMDILQRDVGSLAPSMHRVREGVSLLVEQWRSCCKKLLQDDGSVILEEEFDG